MTKAMAARCRSTAGALAAVALASMLTAMLAGCATGPQQSGARTDVTAPNVESDLRKRAHIRLELASSYFEEGKTEIALDELRQVLATEPSYADGWNLRGLIYMRLGDPAQAEESFRHAVALDPRNSDTFQNYGWLQCQQGRYQDAERSFNQALQNPLYGGRPKTYLTLGICQSRAGDLAAAQRSLAKSYELDAGNPVTGYTLSRVLYDQREYERARFYIRRINNSELANAESLWLGIKVENRLNDPAAMGQLAEQLRKRFPQSPQRASLDRKAYDE
jgi:type IV pilus assembly protein PilF